MTEPPELIFGRRFLTGAVAGLSLAFLVLILFDPAQALWRAIR